VADEETTQSIWLPVIGKALAYLCLKDAEKARKFNGVLERVDFLEAMGLPRPQEVRRPPSTNFGDWLAIRRSGVRMARKRKAVGDATMTAAIPAPEKIARLLAVIVTKEMEKDDAALKLDSIGFDAKEISAILDVGENYVNVAKHRKRAGAKKTRTKA
jgi:hypothetical protein